MESIGKWLVELERKKVIRNLEDGIKKLEQEIQGTWSKIDKSNFCKGYGTWKDGIRGEKYWENKRWDGRVKEQ